MKRDAVCLLGEDLLEEEPALAMDVLGYASRYGISLGWHYLLDLTWILRELRGSASLAILDAGAGTGLLQYILLESGHSVVSADMIPNRRVHELAQRLFRVRRFASRRPIEHHYFTAPGAISGREILRRLSSVRPASLKALCGALGGTLFASAAESPRSEDRDRDGFIEIDAGGRRPMLVFYQSDLRFLDRMADRSVDAIVSVSALEHNTPEEAGTIIEEFQRVLRDDGKMLLTISATSPESRFHEPSHSWMLTEEDIAKTYRLRDGFASNFGDYRRISEGLSNSGRLRRWLSRAYYSSSQNGMPNGVWKPSYVPVGVTIHKPVARRG